MAIGVRWGRAVARFGLGLLLAASASGAAETEPPAVDGIPAALPGAPPLGKELRSRLARALAAQGPDYRPRTRHLGEDGSPLYTNRLLLENSPYLRQHAHNPVNWFPWGDEAFEAATKLDRPVLVSIGYSTCHWCHVMEEEVFDEPEIARLLNAHFVAIKVDRELRPDLDAIYMAATQAMGQSGGWPLNVWVTPEGKPFFAGTYFPPRDQAGRPGFPRVLSALSEQYQRDRGLVAEGAERLATLTRRALEGGTARATQVPDEATLRLARSAFLERIDRIWGGTTGSRMKFPSTVPIRFLLRYHRRTGDEEALELATLTLEKMAAGGIRDHVGGGFHRYATDPHWLVPHFEKMLYDNALLALAYLEARQATGREDFAQVTREILDYVEREMTSPRGGFYSASDADSPGPEGEAEEGRFFTWTPGEIEAALGKDRARVVNAFYGVTLGGDFEGRNVLHRSRAPEQVARQLGMTPEALLAVLREARADLFEVRSRRAPPFRDDKILAAWNGLMISAFARAGFALDEARYVEAAARAADFVLRRMRRDGRLLRMHREGRSAGPAFLEDYAFVTAGLLDLYEAAPDPRWLREALALQQVLDAHYADATGGGYFRTADAHERLLVREKPSRDAAIPSGNSVVALNLLRLAEFTADERHLERALLLFSAFHEVFARNPRALSEMLLALEHYLDATKEVVVVSPATGGDLAAMLAPLRSAHVPNRILSVVTQGEDLEAHAALVPLVEGKVARAGRVTAYVCVNRICELPTSDPAVFAGQLRSVERME